MSRETTIAMYITPQNISSMTSERAIEATGVMSLSPTLERTLKLRKSSSNHDLGSVELTATPKLPGAKCWQAENA